MYNREQRNIEAFLKEKSIETMKENQYLQAGDIVLVATGQGGYSFYNIVTESEDANKITLDNNLFAIVENNLQLESKLEKVDFEKKVNDIIDYIHKKEIINGDGIAKDGQQFKIISDNEGILVKTDSLELNVVDDLNTGGVKKPLSAEQGKVLKQLINAIENGGVNRLIKNEESFNTYKYTGILKSGSSSITTQNQLFSPTLFLDGIRIDEQFYSIELNTGLITLNEIYSDEYDVTWVLIDEAPFHISFSFPTMNLLLTNDKLKKRIKINDIIKILGESNADDGNHYLVKCETEQKINGIDIGNGKWLNEIPNTKISTLSKQIENITEKLENVETEIEQKFKNYCPIPIGGVLPMWNETNPTSLYLGTTWELVTAGKYIQSGSTALQTGGSNFISIAKANLPNVKLKVDSFNATISNHFHHIAVPQSTENELTASNYMVVAAANNDWAGYRLHSSTTVASIGKTSNAGGGTTSNVSPSTETLGSGTALSIQPSYITLKFWKRLS